ncbi:MAG: N-acetylmuramoyl-L-alanine amidase [bacterium]|nr:N-acetylmuramoyl-L-alanine amidase [bacterium]
MCIKLILLLVINSSFTFKYENNSYPIDNKAIEKFSYFKLTSFQPALNFDISLDSTFQKYIVTYQNKNITLVNNNPWIKIGNEVVNSPLSPQVIDKNLYIPLPILNELCKYFLDKTVSIAGNYIVLYGEEGRHIKRVIIDAGHGGKDPGAVGYAGLQEKLVTLDVAKIVAEKLSSENAIDCILTREIDTFISLGKRAKIANDVEASLFLSIHCNAGKRRSATGTEIYFLSPAKTTWARAVEARENASLQYENKEERSELQSILWDLAQTEFLKESNTLAGKLVDGISKSNNIINRGVLQANFCVLRKVYMPACLVEIEFISNPEIEKRMKTDEFKSKIATDIANGVKEFKQWYEMKVNN